MCIDVVEGKQYSSSKTKQEVMKPIDVETTSTLEKMRRRREKKRRWRRRLSSLGALHGKVGILI